jgi:translocation protein SEC63
MYFTLNLLLYLDDSTNLFSDILSSLVSQLTKCQADKDEIGRTLARVKSHMQKPAYNYPVVLKGNGLLRAHLARETNVLSQSTMEDLRYMLQYSSSLIDAMISVCKHQESLKAALNCIKFGEYVAQGMWIKDSELLQLPHFTEKEAGHSAKGKPSAKTIKEHMATPDESKKGLKEQKEDIFKCWDILTNVTINSKVYVDDDEDNNVYEGGICTVAVTHTRNNVARARRSGSSTRPAFPSPAERLPGSPSALRKVRSSASIRWFLAPRAPRVGTYEFVLRVLSNAYVGFDHDESVDLTTKDASALPEYEIHPDDAELDDEPTLFEEMMNANIEADSDNDEEEDSDEGNDDESKEDGIHEFTEEKSKKRELQKAATAGDDSDSDSIAQR